MSKRAREHESEGAMTDFKELREALAAGPTSAIYTHPRDDNKWRENEAFARACDPSTIRTLLERLDAAEKDAERYRKLVACGAYTVSAFKNTSCPWGLSLGSTKGDNKAELDAALDRMEQPE